MNRDVNKQIEKRRLELGLTDTYVASEIGVTIDSYCDLEWYDSEIFEIPSINIVKSLCKVLSIDFFSLFGIKCAFCKQKKDFNNDYLLPRNQLVKKKRESLILSIEELSDCLNLQENAIRCIEEDINFLDTLVFTDFVRIAIALKLPLQILLGVKCVKCNH